MNAMLPGWVTALFDDRNRAPKLLFSVLLLVGLGWHHAQFSVERPEGYRAYLKDPMTHDGESVLMPLWEVTHIRDANMYSVSKSVVGVPVVGDSRGLSVGDTVTVMGTFRATDQAVVSHERVDHPWRKAKGVLSIVALLIAVVLTPRFFGWSNGRVVIRG